MNDALVIIPPATDMVEAVIAPGSAAAHSLGSRGGVTSGMTSGVTSGMTSGVTSGGGARRSARRCLFGRADQKQTDVWLAERLAEIRAEQERRWGFDFHAEVPCASGSPPSRSDYIFTAVSAQSVPNFYRLSYYHTNTANNNSGHHHYHQRGYAQRGHDLDINSTSSSDSENQSPCLMDGAFEGDLDSSGSISGLSFNNNNNHSSPGTFVPSSSLNRRQMQPQDRAGARARDGAGAGDGDEDEDEDHELHHNRGSGYRYNVGLGFQQTSTPLKQTKLTAFMKVQSSRKRLQRSVKTTDLRDAGSSGGRRASSARNIVELLGTSSGGISVTGTSSGTSSRTSSGTGSALTLQDV